MANLEGLHPYVRQQAEKLIETANARIAGGKHKVIIVQGYRSFAEQNKLFAQGRTTKGNIVTDARGGQSMHNFGLGIDFALATLDNKQVSWDTKADFDRDGKADWMEVVSEAKKLSFSWGGDWDSFVDMPHFQMLGGLTERQVMNGIKPKFPSLDKKPAVKLAQAPAKKASVDKKYHTVIKGDTISKIAKKYDVTIAQIKKLNKLDDKYTIKIDQNLRVK